MELKNEKYLFEKYPTIFPKGRKVDKRESLMYYGFECKDGWKELIIDTCNKILKTENGNKVWAVQIKEKFGRLRIYLEGRVTKKISNILFDAEKKSSKICEICGKPGILKTHFMRYQTLCDSCYKIIIN